MELRDALAAIRAGWWKALAGLVLGAGLALGISLLLPRQYQSTMQLFVSATPIATTTGPLQGAQLAQDRVASYTELLTGRDIAQRVIADTRIKTTPKALQGQIQATSLPNTMLIDVTVTSASPQSALAIANALHNEFASAVQQLETAGGGASAIQLVTTQVPQLPSAPSFPRTIMNVVVGAAVGLLIGLLAAVLRRATGRWVHTARQAADLVDAPVIGLVPRDRVLRKRHLARDGRRELQECFRRIRTNLQLMDVGATPTVLLVASALPGEGKSTLMVNLGLSLAEAGRTVTLVEADVGSPTVAAYLGLPREQGLAQVLYGEADLDDVVHPFEDTQLSVLGGGEDVRDTDGVLGSDALPPLLEKLRGRNDLVLVEAPPLLTVADAARLAVRSDGVLMTIRHDRTRVDEVDQAAAVLDFGGTPVLGVVLSMVPRSEGSAPSYGYRLSRGAAWERRGTVPHHGSTSGT